MIHLLTVTLAAWALGGTLLPLYPRAGIPEVENGVSAPFVGEWRVGFPDGPGVVVNEDITSCDAPIVLSAPDASSLDYTSPQGRSTHFELSAFMERTSWFADNGGSSIAVWTTADSFYIYQVDPLTGIASWDDPHVFRRCDA